MKIVGGLLYSKDHEWIKVEGDTAYIGITDFAQHNLGDIVFVELPEVDDEFSIEESFGVVESVKAASDAFMPIDGKIIEVNEDIVDDPALLNSNPYDSWMIKIEITNNSQLDELMEAEDYEKYCDGEV